MPEEFDSVVVGAGAVGSKATIGCPVRTFVSATNQRVTPSGPVTQSP